MSSVYEKELIDNFMSKLQIHIKQKGITKPREVRREALRFARKHDRKWLTNFEECLVNHHKRYYQ